MKRPSVPKDLIRNDSDREAVKDGCWYDHSAYLRVVEFVEQFCILSKGRWSGKRIVLLQWQHDLLRRLYGWMRPPNEDGKCFRRFREVYVEIPKKNGKSNLLSAIVIYHLIADKEASAEVFLAAYTRKQTEIIFGETVKMINASPFFKKILKIKDSFHCKEIFYDTTQSKLMALSSDAPAADGWSSSASIVDEIHRIEDPAIYDVLKYAGLAREQPLILSLTTAGSNRNTVCYRLHDYAEKVNTNAIIDTAFLGIIYAASEKDNINDPKVWRKANPALGEILKEEDFERELKQAKEDLHTLNNFLRLRLNLWVAGEYKYIDPIKWNASKGKIDLDQLKKYPAVGGLDLSSRDDTTCFSMVFDVEGVYHIVPYFWLPADNVTQREKANRVPISQWEKKGYITLTPGSIIDYEFVKQTIVDLSNEFDIRVIYADPYGANHLCTGLIDEGIEVQFIHQNQRVMNAPMNFFAYLLDHKKIRHDHPILSWQASNAIAEPDNYGLIKLSKGKHRDKIDGIQATINAIAALMDENNLAAPGISTI